jgi:hypothetical protein
MKSTSYTAGMIDDLGRDVADLRRYGFLFAEALARVVAGRAMNQHDSAALRAVALIRWGRDDRI